MTCGFPQGIGSKRSRAIEPGNTACGSMISFGCAFAGKLMLPTTWSLSTITEGGDSDEFGSSERGLEHSAGDDPPWRHAAGGVHETDGAVSEPPGHGFARARHTH